MILRKRGFTLIEMLVVIAIIAILAAALFPAIQSAIDQAKATAMKQKGRGVWVAIVSANSEREPLGLSDIWPASIVGSTNSITMKAQDYFNYLMSAGNSNFTANAQNRVCSDLTPSSLSGAGVATGTGVDGQRLPSGNMAWHVAVVSSSSASEDAFLITKNMKLTQSFGGTLSPDSTFTPPGLLFDTLVAAPFGSSHAVWVTRGGGTFDSRPRYLTQDRVNGPETNLVLQCDNSFTQGQ